MSQDRLTPAALTRAHGAAVLQENLSVEDRLVALMEQYERPVYAYLLSIVHDRDLAQDCTQDTFLRAYDALRHDRVITASWLYVVARNRAFDEFRRRKRLDPDGDLLAEIPSREDSAEGRLDVQAVMERLPPADREVLYLFEIAGFSTDEIGTMLGVRGTAIRQRLKRARDRFRALYTWTSD